VTRGPGNVAEIQAAVSGILLARAPRGAQTSFSITETVAAPQMQTGTMPLASQGGRFERISAAEGLSSFIVRAILQDRQGFMWFATYGGGLDKYDGYQFSTYKHDPDDPTTLSQDMVNAVHEDRDGNLWVGTMSGLDRFERTTGTFTHHLKGVEVLAILEDSAGVLWVGTAGSGLIGFDRAAETIERSYRFDPNAPDDPRTLSSDYVWAIYEDRQGELWIGTSGGLDRLDRTDDTFIHYRHDPDDPGSLIHNLVRAIDEDRHGVLWIGTYGGLDRFDRSETFIHYRHDPEESHSLSDNAVWAILEDSAGTMWVGTVNGLDRLVLSPSASYRGESFDRAQDVLVEPSRQAQDQNRFLHYRHDPVDPRSLSSDVILSLYEDRSGVVWIGTFGGGLSKYNHRVNQITHYTTSLSDSKALAILEDQSGVLWIGTANGGLNRLVLSGAEGPVLSPAEGLVLSGAEGPVLRPAEGLDRQAGVLTVFQHDPDAPASLSSNAVYAVYEDRAGVLWVGAGGWLEQFDPQTETFIHHQYLGYQVEKMAEDRSDALWIGTPGGLFRLDRDRETLVHYGHAQNDPDSLSHDDVQAIYEDRAGALWVGTLAGGLNLWDPVNERFVHYRHEPDDPNSLSRDHIGGIYEDSTGVIWIGTIGGGLSRFDRASQAFTHYTEKDGLAGDSVGCMLADADGFLWLRTIRGLSKFDPQAETFRNYDERDGLQSGGYVPFACFAGQTGKMYFSGSDGVFAFYPEQMRDNPQVPPIVITAFNLFNQTVRRDLPPNEQIQLSYRENSVSFEFAALDYTVPEKNQYAYMMAGLDEDWVYAGTRRYAEYRNLRPGDYVFRVKGSNNDGVWNEKGASLRISIIPPFWEAWWFRGIVALALAGSAIAGFRLRVRGIEARSRELERQVAGRTKELAALHAAEQRRAEQFRVISEVGRHITSILDVDQLLEEIVRLLKETFGYYLITVGLIEGDEVVFKAGVKDKWGDPQFRPPPTKVGGRGITAWVAATGEPLLAPDVSQEPRFLFLPDAAETRSELAVPLKTKTGVIGVLNVESDQLNGFDESDLAVLQSMALQAAIAIENARLYEQAQQVAVMEERSRLARELHDAVTQTLFSSSLIAEALPALWEHDHEEGRQLLGKLQQMSRGALAEMRALLLELRPATLIEASLGNLLRQLGDAVTGREGIPVTVAVEGECALPSDVHVAFYRIAQEALNNVVKHAQASQVEVSLRYAPPHGGESAELCIRDDGRGFDPNDLPADRLGLAIMHERAEAVGAILEVEGQPGRGTQITVMWTNDKG
jgi:signal transduction histidine kinase/ligand-binding sensor domain-containing protein